MFPCLRQLGMKFYAHGPLFAGVLATQGGRSAGVNPIDAAARAKEGFIPGPTEVLPDKPHDPATGRHLEPAVMREARVRRASPCAACLHWPNICPAHNDNRKDGNVHFHMTL